MSKDSLELSSMEHDEPTFLSSQGWYHFSQLLINSSYLQPLKLTSNGRKQKEWVKENLRNGHIEREIHGAMHASRVAWSIVMLHSLCAQQYSEQVQEKTQALMAFSKLSQEQLFLLIRYVGLGHDAARENERQDAWESKSATLIAEFLQEHGIEPKLAEIFSHLASLKDTPQELADYLTLCDLDEKIIESLQYARLLISLADCFDIIRCCSNFNFELIENKLVTVFPYTKDKDAAVFFDYAKNMLQLIKQQKDLYFPTKLIESNEVFSIEDCEEDYSVQEKVKLEHADCAPAAMLAALNQNQYFQRLLNTETPECSDTYDKEPAFNPYIHGTNSTALVLMQQTDFQLMSATEMLEQYSLAPLCGEIEQGGLDSAMSNCKPCFAKLSGEDNSNEYSLETVIKNYAQINQKSITENCLYNIEAYVGYAPSNLFSKINIINIYLARARQFGIDFTGISAIGSLEEDFQKSMDILYLYLLFATHIIPKQEVQELSDEDLETLVDDICDNLSLKKVLKKLQESKISIKNIYKNPTDENCQEIIKLLSLPEGCKVEQLFEYAEKVLEETDTECKLDGTQWKYVVNNCWNFEYMLYTQFLGTFNKSDFMAMAPRIAAYMKELERRFSVTKKLLQIPPKPLTFSAEDSNLLAKPLPIILCYEQSRHMRILSMNTQEYRAQKPLKLGKDIQIIATDTEDNISVLQAYSDRNNLGLKIISFADLRNARDSLKTDFPLFRQQVLQRHHSDSCIDNSGKSHLAIRSLSQPSADGFGMRSITVLKEGHMQPASSESTLGQDVITELESTSTEISLIASKQEIQPEPENPDIVKLNEFCENQKSRFTQPWIRDSLLAFKAKAEQIILSTELNKEEKRVQLKACAHKEFEHRHYIPRLLADALILISSLILIGLAVGITRVLNGHSFFFSTAMTKREEEFIGVANEMFNLC